MRLWSIHPRYLDAKGLVALWREALLARAVLRGETRGYRHHPQLARFRACDRPRAAIGRYLKHVHAEALSRGYAFDSSKLARARPSAARPAPRLCVTTGQLDYEWTWLLQKLAHRSPADFERLRAVGRPDPNPLFRVVPGNVEAWERARGRRQSPLTACAGLR